MGAPQQPAQAPPVGSLMQVPQKAAPAYCRQLPFSRSVPRPNVAASQRPYQSSGKLSRAKARKNFIAHQQAAELRVAADADLTKVSGQRGVG